MSEELLYLQEEVMRLRNSKKRYLKIPDGYFNEVSHGDISQEIKRKEDPKEIQIIYVFYKKDLKVNKRKK